jgi:hypothetical protein
MPNTSQEFKKGLFPLFLIFKCWWSFCDYSECGTLKLELFFNIFVLHDKKLKVANYTGRFITFSVITNIYNKKTKGPTLMEFFTATRKLKKFFWQLEKFDVCTTGDTAYIDTIFMSLPHTRQHGCIDILHCCNDPCLKEHYETPCIIMSHRGNFASMPSVVWQHVKMRKIVS